MSKKASPALIGGFTLLGLLLAAGALLLFGAGKFFEKSSSIILYFEKSAYGLLVGSEVRFGGVRIGRVTSIQVIIDQKQNRKIIPVVVELSHKELNDVGLTSDGSIDLLTEEGVNKAISEGLRARMKQQSLLTGQLYIEFDMIPDSPIFDYKPAVASPYPNVPTLGTEMDDLIKGIADGLKKFNDLDLAGEDVLLRRLDLCEDRRRDAVLGVLHLGKADAVLLDDFTDEAVRFEAFDRGDDAAERGTAAEGAEHGFEYIHHVLIDVAQF